MSEDARNHLGRIALCLLLLGLIVLFSLPARAAAPAPATPTPAVTPTSDASPTPDLDPMLLWSLVGLAALLLIKVLFAVATALRVPAGQPGAFDIRLLPEFLKTNVLPYMVPLAGMAVVSVFVPAMKAIYLGSAAVYAAKLVAEIRDNVVQFFGPGAAPPTR